MLLVPIESDADSQTKVNQIFGGHREVAMIERRQGERPILVLVAAGDAAVSLRARIVAGEDDAS